MHLPLSKSLLVVSGRSSFEIVQKAVAAGIPAVASVSAASSLAVALAERANVTLIGFVRDDSMTVYRSAGRFVEH
jgi:FdhD protein